MNVKEFLDGIDKKSFISYEGSLTTPPCTEGVRWTVLLEPQPISDEQLKHFTDRYADNPNFASGAGNNRITQPLNGRIVYQSDYDINHIEKMQPSSQLTADLPKESC